MWFKLRTVEINDSLHPHEIEALAGNRDYPCYRIGLLGGGSAHDQSFR